MKILSPFLILCCSAHLFAQNIFPTSGNVGINLGGATSQNKLQIGPNLQGWNGNDLVLGNANGSMAIHTDASQTYLYGGRDIAIRPGYGTYGILAKVNGYVGIQSTNLQGTLQVGDYRPVVVKSNGGNGVYGSEIGFPMRED